LNSPMSIYSPAIVQRSLRARLAVHDAERLEQQ
jgi:hypothetical protein